jgi:hypothetical protein
MKHWFLGFARKGIAEKALLFLGFLVAAVWLVVPIAAHGVLNWYVTGFDDLLIFSVTYFTVAKKEKKEFAAISGLLLAVATMVVLVVVAGTWFQQFGDYAKLSAAVPIFYAFLCIWETYKERIVHWMLTAVGYAEALFGRPFPGLRRWLEGLLEESPEPEDAWWMHYKVFGRAFFGFAANCLDDIALNTSMIATVYADHSVEYLSGIMLGAITMVVLAMVVGRRIGEHPYLQIGGYALAAGVILGLFDPLLAAGAALFAGMFG